MEKSEILLPVKLAITSTKMRYLTDSLASAVFQWKHILEFRAVQWHYYIKLVIWKQTAPDIFCYQTHVWLHLFRDYWTLVSPSLYLPTPRFSQTAKFACGAERSKKNYVPEGVKISQVCRWITKYLASESSWTQSRIKWKFFTFDEMQCSQSSSQKASKPSLVLRSFTYTSAEDRVLSHWAQEQQLRFCLWKTLEAVILSIRSPTYKSWTEIKGHRRGQICN